MIVRSFLLVLSALVFSGCGILDYFMIADSESSANETNAGDAPPSLQWANPNLDLMMPFDLGSFCWSGGNVAMCVDKMPPDYSEEQHLIVSDTMELVFAEPFPSSVSLNLHPGSNLMTRIAEIPLEATLGEDGRILLSFPEDIEGLYVLMVFATWEGGDAFYTLPIDVER